MASLWSKSICVTCKLLMSVYFDMKSLYPHLKVNWNMLMCKICIARRLVVDIFPWCNANSVPFPSGTLVARRIGNGSITWQVKGLVTALAIAQKMNTVNSFVLWLTPIALSSKFLTYNNSIANPYWECIGPTMSKRSVLSITIWAIASSSSVY